MTIQCIQNGQIKTTIPGVHLRGEFPNRDGIFLVSKAACAAEGIDPKSLCKASPNSATEKYYLKMGMNPDGNNLVDEQVESDRRSAEYAVKAEAEKRVKYSKEIAEAAATGKDVMIQSKRWTENGRAKEGGEWGDYLFVCTYAEWVTPSAEFKSKSSRTNTY